MDDLQRKKKELKLKCAEWSRGGKSSDRETMRHEVSKCSLNQSKK